MQRSPLPSVGLKSLVCWLRDETSRRCAGKPVNWKSLLFRPFMESSELLEFRYMQILDPSSLFSCKVSSADPDFDDATLKDMLHQLHRAQAYCPLRENLFVSLSSSSMSDKTVRSFGEHRNSEAQIRTLLDNQKEQILEECQAKSNQHEFQAARAEKDQQLLQGQALQRNLELHETRHRSFTEMEELRKFQSLN